MNNSPPGWPAGNSKIFTSYNYYLSNAVWQKPKNSTYLYVELVSGGGGGGSAAAGSSAARSASGASGTFFYRWGLLSEIPDLVTVTVGAGGTGGAGVAATSEGNDGSNGGTSSFGSFLVVRGGGGGGKGTLSTTGTPGAVLLRAASLYTDLYSGAGTNMTGDLATIASHGPAGGQGFAAYKSAVVANSGNVAGGYGDGVLIAAAGTAGNNGNFPGAGGGHIFPSTSGTSGKGGDGAQGFVKVWTW